MTQNITVKDVANAALKVIDKRGDDFIYLPPEGTINDMCVYSADEGATGSCLFGAALIDELGFTYDDSWEGQDVVNVLDAILGIEITWWPKAELLASVQSSQDTGSKYGLLRRTLEEVANS